MKPEESIERVRDLHIQSRIESSLTAMIDENETREMDALWNGKPIKVTIHTAGAAIIHGPQQIGHTDTTNCPNCDYPLKAKTYRREFSPAGRRFILKLAALSFLAGGVATACVLAVVRAYFQR